MKKIFFSGGVKNIKIEKEVKQEVGLKGESSDKPQSYLYNGIREGLENQKDPRDGEPVHFNWGGGGNRSHASGVDYEGGRGRASGPYNGGSGDNRYSGW